MMTTEERIEKLENELTNAKRRSRWTLTAAALVLVAVVTSGNIRPPADEVKARSFSVVDAQGRTRVLMYVGADGRAGLAVLDAQGNRRAALGVTAGGHPTVAVTDAQERPRAALGVTPEGGPALSMFDAQGNRRSSLGLHNTGIPYLQMGDAQGRRIWTAP